MRPLHCQLLLWELGLLSKGTGGQQEAEPRLKPSLGARVCPVGSSSLKELMF